MAALPFRLLSESQCQAVIKEISHILPNWSSHWFASPQMMLPKIKSQQSIDWKEGPWFILGSAPDLWMAWKLDFSSSKAIVAAMMQGGLSGIIKATPLMTSLMEDAVKDFFLRITNIHPDMGFVHSPLENGFNLRSGYGSGALQLELRGDSVRQNVALGGSVVEFLSRRPGVSSPTKLTNREQLLGPYSARLEVQIGQAEITLQELADMEVGDVIRLETNIDQSFVAFSPGTSKPLAKVHLGLIDDHKAIQFIE